MILLDVFNPHQESLIHYKIGIWVTLATTSLLTRAFCLRNPVFTFCQMQSFQGGLTTTWLSLHAPWSMLQNCSSSPSDCPLTLLTPLHSNPGIHIFHIKLCMNSQKCNSLSFSSSSFYYSFLQHTGLAVHSMWGVGFRSPTRDQTHVP